MKIPLFMKVLTLFSFIALITCYVAYRVGAFENLFSDKTKIKAPHQEIGKKEKAKNNKIDNNNDEEDELMGGSKSKEIIEGDDIAETKQVNSKPEKNSKNSSSNTESNKGIKVNRQKLHMPGPKSAEVFDLKEEKQSSKEKEVNSDISTSKPLTPNQINVEEKK